MDNKEIILSRIAEILSRKNFLVSGNSEIQSRLKCSGLAEYFEKYSDYLTPYYFKTGYSQIFTNANPQFDIFFGLDSIFSDLYHENKSGEILTLLKELTKSFNVCYIEEFAPDSLEELSKLYELLGLTIAIEFGKIKVTACTLNNTQRIDELFSVEDWLKRNHAAAYDAYDAAIDAYKEGHAGACIESCRTCLVSIFSEYKGTESFAKWMRGIYNTSGENANASVKDLSQALDTELRKEDLADFFYENRAGKLTKTKTVYMIYSMMSDYGTHRNEATQESPSPEDALFSLRLTDSILFWIYSRRNTPA